MDLKYTLLKETKVFEGHTLHRIEALKDFGDVKKGDKGGWIEKEFNLSQDEGCWVGDEACVYGSARVCGYAQVGGNAVISNYSYLSGFAHVYGDAVVCDDTWLHGHAQVYGNAVICGNAQVYGDAKVYGAAQIYGKARVYGNVSMAGDAQVYDDAKVYGNARVYGDAQVRGRAKVFDNAWVYGHAWVYGGAWVYENARVCVAADVEAKSRICGDAVVKQMCDCIVIQNWWSSGRWLTYTKSNGKWKVGCFYGTGKELVRKAYADGKQKGRCYEAIVNAVEKINSIL